MSQMFKEKPIEGNGTKTHNATIGIKTNKQQIQIKHKQANKQTQTNKKKHILN